MSKYLDQSGLSRLWSVVKDNIQTPLTEHLATPHAPSNAEENIIISIKKNGTAIAPTNKIVDIEVPTKVSELSNDSVFATEAVVDEKIKGANHLSLEVVASLPTASEAKANTVYFVPKSSGASGNQYDEYMLVTGSLEKIGDAAADLSSYVTQDYVAKADDALITEIFNSLQSSAERYIGTDNLATFWTLVSALITANTQNVTDVASRVKLLELCVMNSEIEGNPFYVTFETLDGCNVEGVWNTANSRIDF